MTSNASTKRFQDSIFLMLRYLPAAWKMEYKLNPYSKIKQIFKPADHNGTWKIEPEAISVMLMPHFISHSNLPTPGLGLVPPLVGSLVHSRNTTAGAPPSVSTPAIDIDSPPSPPP